MTIPFASHYHVGMIVADVQAARARLTESMGVTWGPVMHLNSVEYRDAQGSDLALPTTICYSVGDPCLELIEEVPGTVWVRNAHSNLHHVGFWSDDLVTDSRSLTAVGCPLQLCGRAGSSAPESFAYHRDEELGIRIEVVDASMRDAMAFLFRPEAAPS
jgi:glyoxalase/bleomycin resistance protein/dioxygenase superfamily protein